MIVATENSTYNADIAKALTELINNIYMDINNQTIHAVDINVDGKSCKCLFLTRYVCDLFNHMFTMIPVVITGFLKLDRIRLAFLVL